MMRHSSQKREPHPLIMRWRDPDAPLPRRAIRAAGPTGPAADGKGDRTFDFCAAIRRLLADIVQRCPEFRHVETPRVLLTVTQARGEIVHGLQARVTPLRFLNGALTRKRRGVLYQVQRYFHNDTEFLYVMTFCLPRFLNQSFDPKLITLFHELYHIHPACNGDFRRHEGRYAFHTRHQGEYDKKMVSHARDYLGSKPGPSVLDFLRLDFAQLESRHGTITGIVVPRPKIIPLIRPSPVLSCEQT